MIWKGLQIQSAMPNMDLNSIGCVLYMFCQTRMFKADLRSTSSAC